MNLLRTILSSVWMIDQDTRNAAVPLVIRLMHGEEVTFQDQTIDITPFAVDSKQSPSSRQSIRYRNYNDAPPGSIAIHRIMGTVTKQDQYCGPSGTETLMRNMANADRHQNIGAHLLEIDSGGGEATNIETVARYIRNEIKKPVIAWFNGVAASAAYYIAASADEIYSSKETDIVGSIGTMITFADFKSFYESQGLKIHEIYADQSVLKNADFQEALEGNYNGLKEGLLNPYAQRFIDTVKEFRPQLQTKEAFQGKTYMTAEAIQIGMIDGMKKFDHAVERASQLSKIHSQNNSLHMSKKTFARINAALGYDIEIQNGGAFLRAEELDVLDRNLTGEGVEAVETSALENIQNTLNTMNTQLGTIQNSVQANADAITANTTRIEEVSAEAPEGPTVIETQGDPYAGMNDVEKAEAKNLEAYNAKMAAAAEGHDTMRVKS